MATLLSDTRNDGMKGSPPADPAGSGHREVHAGQDRCNLVASALSHDLRAPLRAVDGFARALQRSLGDRLDAMEQGYLQHILDANRRADGLIDALAAWLRLDGLPLRLGPVDISFLADWAAAELSDQHPQRTADIDIQPGLMALGDEHLLRQLMQQLLANAWAFAGPANAPVHVRLRGQGDGSGLHLELSDEGIGFDMAYAGRLFEPFSRLHTSDEGAGHGLGLARARMIVARHGGAIALESTPGAGARVQVFLPGHVDEGVQS